MTKQQPMTPKQPMVSNESEPLALDKESLKDLDPSVDQQLAMKTGCATVRSACI